MDGRNIENLRTILRWEHSSVNYVRTIWQPDVAFPYASFAEGKVDAFLMEFQHSVNARSFNIKKEMLSYCFDISIQNLYSAVANLASILLGYDAKSFALLDLRRYCHSSLQNFLSFTLNLISLILDQLPHLSCWKTQCCHHHWCYCACNEQHLLCFRKRTLRMKAKEGDDWPSRMFSHLQSGLSHWILGHISYQDSFPQFAQFGYMTRCREGSGCSKKNPPFYEGWRPLCSFPASELWRQMVKSPGLVLLWYDCHLFELIKSRQVCPPNSCPHSWAWTTSKVLKHPKEKWKVHWTWVRGSEYSCHGNISAFHF